MDGVICTAMGRGKGHTGTVLVIDGGARDA
jgi:hypothetical protein